jgi:GT2 family glycosyltransferase
VLCLLNNDVEVTHQWLEPIIKTFEQSPETAIIQPKLIDHKQKNHFEYAGAAGGFIDKYGFPFCRGRIFSTIEEDHGQFNDQFPIFWASGACFFIRKNVYDELNGFDESFFAHMEEIDLCWRAFNCDHKTLYIGQSTVYHVGGSTLSETNPTKTYLNFRNSLFMLTKNVHSNKLFLILLIRLIFDGIAGIKFMIQGNPGHTSAVVRAHFSFYKRFPKLIKDRSKVLTSKKYYQKRSIVWSYFVNNKKTFNSL